MQISKSYQYVVMSKDSGRPRCVEVQKFLNAVHNKCLHCGTDVYSEELVCFYCNKEKSFFIKAEIYDKEKVQNESDLEAAFSELLFGKINFRSMRRHNLQDQDNNH
jgi:hypothetical protein